MIVLTFFAFLSGIVTILSPCILPVLPIILSGSIGGKRKPLGVVTGFVLSFSLFTLLLSTLVQALNISPDALRVAAIAIIISFGVVLLIPALQHKFELLASRVVSRRQGEQKSGFKGGLLVGGSLGLLWTPCVGPIMASVISLAVSQQVDGGAVVIIIAYAAGTALPMFGVMRGGRKLLSRFPKVMSSTGKIQRIFGIIMVIAGLSIGFGLDRRFQTLVLTAFPNYGSGLTAFESSELVQKALNDRSFTNISKPPENGKLGDYGFAPEIVTDGEWFNTDIPLSMESLKGKVVLIDFWTYSCVNCVRTLPYLNGWNDAYGDNGLVIIGVHSPEFAFERDASNVRKAIEDLGIRWPVVLDNNFKQWRAYDNRYWPAHYFIDAEGRLRYFHFGEGEYENSEKVIRSLLKEAGYAISNEMKAGEWEGNESRTAETYLGWGRSEGFLSEDSRVNDQAEIYSFNERPKNGEWGLEGEWIIREDFIETTSAGVLELGFYSKDVFLVIEPKDENVKVEIEVDGSPVEVLFPDESRLYSLASFDKAEERLLKLKIEGRLRFYAFTFG